MPPARTAAADAPAPPQALLAPPRFVRLKLALVVLLIVGLAVATFAVPPRDLETHNILHHLNFLPFMLAGLFFGWRGALQALVLASVLQAPLIARHWQHFRLDAQDQIVELAIFGAAGVIAGLLADRERFQRRRAVTTATELSAVYRELQSNIEQLRKAERLSAAGELAASLAHEIRNPLASISGAAGILQRGQASPANQAECLSILTLESQRLNKLLSNFLDFARPRLPRLQPTDPAELIASTLALARHAAPASAVLPTAADSTDPAPPSPTLLCDPEQIKQVLLNLLLNAIQATPPHAPEASVRIAHTVSPTHLTIDVLDRGPGISPGDEARIFDPFFTTKPNGTGLGLSVAANIVAQHGGSLSCRRNQPGPGMVFSLVLPLRPPSLAASLTGDGSVRSTQDTPR